MEKTFSFVWLYKAWIAIFNYCEYSIQGIPYTSMCHIYFNDFETYVRYDFNQRPWIFCTLECTSGESLFPFVSLTGAMAFVGSAVRRVVSAVRPPLSPLCRTSTRSYSSEHTKEKSVPYEKTLKQDNGASSGPTKPLPRWAHGMDGASWFTFIIFCRSASIWILASVQDDFADKYVSWFINRNITFFVSLLGKHQFGILWLWVIFFIHVIKNEVENFIYLFGLVLLTQLSHILWF